MPHTSAAHLADAQTAVATPDGRRAGLLLVGLGGGVMTVLMWAAAMAPNYDFGGGAISDLGVVPETALLFNGLLVLAGVVNLAAGYLFFRTHGRGWVFAPFVLASLGLVGAGLFPLDTGAPHSLAALAAFVGVNLEAIAIATRVRGPMRAISALAGIVGLAFVGVMIAGDAGNPAVFGPIGHGGAERMIVYPAMLWMVAFGGSLLGSGRAE